MVRHGADPSLGLKVPAAHSVQFPPSEPVEPGLQVQLPMLLDPCCRDNEFVGHIKHAAEPVALLNVPAAHAVHGPPSGPEKPVAHSQAVIVVLPSGETEFAGQIEHVPEPDTFLYLPASHGQIPILGKSEHAHEHGHFSQKS